MIPWCFFGRTRMYTTILSQAYLRLFNIDIISKASVVRGKAFITLAFLCVNN
jgi:hypothetical protein